MFNTHETIKHAIASIIHRVIKHAAVTLSR